MATEVTDPAILAQLNGSPPQLREVTDPTLLGQLNGTPATAIDRAQAIPVGFNSGVAGILGMPVDTLVNAANLVSSGIEAGMLASGHVPSTAWDPIKNKERIPLTSDWFRKQMGSAAALPRPDDAASRYIATGAGVIPAAITAGGSIPEIARTAVSAVPPALAGQFVGEKKPFGNNEGMNNAAVILTQALAANAMPRARVDNPNAEVSNQTVRNAQDIDLVVPPATTNNTIGNRLIESIAGKRNVEQRFQVANQAGVNQAARHELGLPGTGQITEAEIAGVRGAAAPAYQAMRNAGQVQTGSDPQFVQALQNAQQRFAGAANVLTNSGAQGLTQDIHDILSQPSHTSGDLLDTVAVLRDRGNQAFRAGDNGMGAAYRQVSDAIEQQIDTSLTRQNGGIPTPVVQNYREARRQLAIAHTIEDARNEGSGNISGRKLAQALARGTPLTGQLETVARAAQLAPRAFAEPTHSAGVNHLGLWGTILGGMALGHETAPGGLGVALGAIPGGLALGREGAARYALGPGQRNAVMTQLAPIDPRVLAAALASNPGISQ